MLNTEELVQTGSRLTLTQWASRTLGCPERLVQVRVRGNNLHILCEGETCPEVAIVAGKVRRELAATDLNAMLPKEHPQIYEVFLYGRVLGSQRPDWSLRIDPNNPDSLVSGIRTPPGLEGAGGVKGSGGGLWGGGSPPSRLLSHAAPTAEVRTPLGLGGAGGVKGSGAILAVKDRTLARQGNALAIARYLSETLSGLNVGIKVVVREIKSARRNPEIEEPKTGKPNQKNPTPTEQKPTPKNRRLWVFCQSAYSPDPLLLAEPLAERVRDLQLEGFRDACIMGLVSGETKAEWILRVDLTPPDKMLEEWARWGDIQALTRLLNQELGSQGLQVSGVLKEATLHLFCSRLNSLDASTTFEFDLEGAIAAIQASVPLTQNEDPAAKEQVIAAIAPALEAIAPQGIHAATLYGQLADSAPPQWVHWLDLPARSHPALATSPMDLARQGDQEALTFLLDRLLNPDLDSKLATGGIGIQILHKADRLHIMTDAPVCPPQGKVGPPVAKFLRQLDIPEIAGVRVYGRRSGQKQPVWRYGINFTDRQPQGQFQEPESETTPEFAVSDTYGGDLLPEPGGLVLHPDLTIDLRTEIPSQSNDLQECLTKQSVAIPKPPQDSSPGIVTRTLMGCGLFIPVSETDVRVRTRKGTGSGALVAWVWGTLGLMLTLHADWLLASWQPQRLQPQGAASVSILDKGKTQQAEQTTGNARQSAFNSQPFTSDTQPLSLQKSPPPEENVFNASGFTSRDKRREEKKETSSSSGRPTPVYPTFNSQQMDEQVAKYLKYVATAGPPDVLIVGSSRALRGVDPLLLEQALADQHPGMRVFNFGVNGATAQVVDLLLRQVLNPAELPKLILWADGARAFNSGRQDRTYEAIAASVGFKQLTSGLRPTPPPRDSEGGNSLASLTTALAETAETSVSIATGYQSLDKWLNQTLASVSVTYPERERLKTRLGDPLAAFSTQLSKVIGETPLAKEAGQETSLETTEGDRLQPDYNGFLPLEERFNVATYYQNHPRVPGNYDGDYESFQLDGSQSAALKNVMQFAQSHQIALVFVNLPLTQDYLDPVRQGYEEIFQKYMLGISMQKGLIFRDLSGLWPTENQNFSDPSHLNRYGASEVSKRLAQDPMIPWPATTVKK